MKRLAMFLDGTWNEPDNNTNVWRLKLMVDDVCKDNIEQLCYYSEGVGTSPFDYVLGGFFALGLSEHIRLAYQWLMENYDEGDHIFLFGFSRGSYIARSLAGLIATCGLLIPGAPMPILQLFDRYKLASNAATNIKGKKRTLVELQQLMENGVQLENLPLEERWLIEFSRRIPLHFIGVFDTVGAVGIPIGSIERISSSTLTWHNTRLSSMMRNVYHALAIDEHRASFAPNLYGREVSDEYRGNSLLVKLSNRRSIGQQVEQRWFCGAHSNVGGGYRNDPLSLIPLNWITDKAESCGLAFRSRIELKGGEYLSPIRDSFAEFVFGIYQYLPILGKRYYRPLMNEQAVTKDGVLHDVVNQTIDKSVILRVQSDPTYRPKNLLQWAEAVGIDLLHISPANLCMDSGQRRYSQPIELPPMAKFSNVVESVMSFTNEACYSKKDLNQDANDLNKAINPPSLLELNKKDKDVSCDSREMSTIH